MSIVLSHRTAWLLYHAPHRPAVMESLPPRRAALAASYPAERLVARAIGVLKAAVIDSCELSAIDVTVANDRVRSKAPQVKSHVCTAPLPAGSIRRIASGVFVVSPELCFIQMARVFRDRRELIEFGCELCGGYEWGLKASEDYRERSPLTTVERIASVVSQLEGLHGVKAARWALRFTRDGSRSPMETAHIMTLVLPRRLGGLGIADMRMDWRIDIPPALRGLTRRGYVVCDGCSPLFRLDVEYNGFHHNDELRKVADEERRNVLEAMGYRVKVLTKGAFFDAPSFRRHLQSIIQIVGLRPRDVPDGFWERQEELRRFVLRHWTGEAAYEAEASSPAIA